MKFHEPASVSEAVKLLAAEPEARCLAGGATLVAMMNAQIVEPKALVSLRKIAALDGIKVARGGTVIIGAMTRHRVIAEAIELAGGQAIVRKAAAKIGHPAIRNMGTIGGSISHADPAAEYPPALVAADAVIEAVGPNGRRKIPAREFFVDYLTTALVPGELLTAVTVPKAPPGSVAVYRKFARVSGDFATVSVAVVLAMSKKKCRYIALVVGACGARPVRVAEAEQRLKGSALGDDEIGQACELILAQCDPVSDFRGTAEYRRMLVPVLVQRAIAAAQSKAQASGT